MERETLKSRLGFILLSAGCAIGIGNVWKFPYIAGQGGGGAFVLFYLVFLVILGLPIMTMEFAVGRASRKSPVRAYQALEKPGQKWHIHGYLTLIGCYLLMMFYTTAASSGTAIRTSVWSMYRPIWPLRWMATRSTPTATSSNGTSPSSCPAVWRTSMRP